MVWHKLFFLECHWKRTDGGVALLYPMVASSAPLAGPLRVSLAGFM